jgi:hypothetical protein
VVPVVVPEIGSGTSVTNRHILRGLQLPYWFPTVVPKIGTGTTVANRSKLENLGNRREPPWGTSMESLLRVLKNPR